MGKTAAGDRVLRLDDRLLLLQPPILYTVNIEENHRVLASDL